MNRKIKNFVMIVMIFVISILSCFTMGGAVKKDMPYKEFKSNQNQGETSPNVNSEEMPERPSGNFNSKNQHQMPEMSENEFQNGEIPDISGLSENLQQDFENGNFSNTDFKPSINIVDTVLFIIQAFILAVLIMYLIMSKFNKITIKETLQNSKKIIILIVLTVLLTTGLTLLQILLCRNVFSTKNRNPLVDKQIPIKDYNNINVIENNNDTSNTENS